MFIGVFLLLVKLHDHGVQPFYDCGKWLYGQFNEVSFMPWYITFLVLSLTNITAVSFILLAPSPLYNQFVKLVCDVCWLHSNCTFFSYRIPSRHHLEDDMSKLCCTNPQNTKLQQFQVSSRMAQDQRMRLTVAGLYLLLRFLIFMLAALAPMA